MAQNEFDPVDIAPLILLPAFTSFLFGVFSLQLSVFGGFDLGAVVWSGFDISVTWAAILSIASAAMIVITNEIDGSDYEGYEYAMIVVVLALPALYVAVPFVSSIINSADIWRLVAWLLTAVTATYISYAE